MKMEIHSARSKEAKLNNNFSVWRELSNTHVYQEDDKSSTESLDSMLQNLCDAYGVYAEHIEISELKDVSKEFGKRYIKVEKSRISIKFKALTDKHAFLFMHAVRYDIPGFVAVKFFEVIRERDLNDIAGTKKTPKAKTASAVSGTMTFELYKISGQHI